MFVLEKDFYDWVSFLNSPVSGGGIINFQTRPFMTDIGMWVRARMSVCPFFVSVSVCVCVWKGER